jgi:hypothetical protein
MQTIGNLITNDGTLIPIALDETISLPRYWAQVAVVLTQTYYPINSPYAPRATWPNGGCPARLDPGTCFMATVMEAGLLCRAGAAKDPSRVGSTEPPRIFDI